MEIKAMKGRGNGTKQRKTRKHHEQKKDQKSRYKLDWNQQRSFGGPKYATHFGPAKLLCLPHRLTNIVASVSEIVFNTKLFLFRMQEFSFVVDASSYEDISETR